MKMKIIMARLQRFGRFRQVHTIVSQETIKPSSQTPPHLKTHNLSVLDHFGPNIHMPWVFFYRNYKKGDIGNLKKSLSQCLTHYYPLVGRLPTPCAGYVDCNDEGVEFLEASHDSPLDDFIRKKERDESIYNLFPNGLGCIVGKSSPNLVEVQLNHFNGGGVAVAVSISHRVVDGFTMSKFIDHWARIARGGSSIKPDFFSSSTSNKIPEFPISRMNEVKYVTKIFVFPNSKINELKKKVSNMGIAPTNPTRVEVLTSLIFKCAVYASITKTGLVKPAYLLHSVNTRNTIVKNNPENAAGNFATFVASKTDDPSKILLHEVAAGLRKVKKELEGLQNVQQVGEKLVNTFSMLQGDLTQQYASSSICGFPFYEVDFGWGKPVEVMLAGPNSQNKMLVLMDTPNKDGIVATVHLPEDEMLIFQENEELISYVN